MKLLLSVILLMTFSEALPAAALEAAEVWSCKAVSALWDPRLFPLGVVAGFRVLLGPVVISWKSKM